MSGTGKVEKQVPVCIRQCPVSKSTTQDVIELLSDILISGRRSWDGLIESCRARRSRPSYGVSPCGWAWSSLR